MEYNEAEKLMRFAEEVFPDHSLAIVSELIGMPANPTVVEPDPDEEAEMELVRQYALEINLGGNMLVGPDLFTQEVVNKAKRVIKKSEVKDCQWSLRGGVVLVFENI